MMKITFCIVNSTSSHVNAEYTKISYLVWRGGNRAQHSREFGVNIPPPPQEADDAAGGDDACETL